jgi:polygalacturonase
LEPMNKPKRSTIALAGLLAFTGLILNAGSARAQDEEKTIAWYSSHAPFPMPSIATPHFPDRSFNIRDYGAIDGGQALNTAVFEKTIQVCAAAGGGHVIVPEGQWLTGPIALQNNIDLHLEKGALVQFSRDHAQYPMIQPPGSNNMIVTSPVYGFDLQNIAITGEGVFDGGGDSWRPVKKSKATDAQWKNLLASGDALSRDGEIWWPSRDAMEGEEYMKDLRKRNAADPRKIKPADYLPARDYLRPLMVYLVNCHTILLQGVTIRNSPKYVFYPNSCTELTMDHVNIFNEWWAQNGDGVDISACRNVMLYHCTVSAGDDAICMKSSGTRHDGSEGPALENVIIAGCTVLRGHGGFVIGSNTDGGMRNIAVSDCNFIGTDARLRFKSNMGRGGLVDKIFVQDIAMRNIVHEAIVFDTYYEDMPAGRVSDPNAAKPQDNTMTISADKGMVATQAKNIVLNHVKLTVSRQPLYDLDKTAEVHIND